MQIGKVEAENELLRGLLYELLCRVVNDDVVTTSTHPKEWKGWLKRAREAVDR